MKKKSLSPTSLFNEKEVFFYLFIYAYILSSVGEYHDKKRDLVTLATHAAIFSFCIGSGKGQAQQAYFIQPIL